MNSPQEQSWLLIEAYPESIEGIVSSDVFVSSLKASIDVQGNAIQPGEIPGVKTICGSVGGAQFKIRKAGAFANPCARDIEGIAEPAISGCKIKFRRVNRASTTFFQGMILIIIILSCFGSVTSFLFTLNHLSNTQALIDGIKILGMPLILLLGFVLLSKLSEVSGESDEEEVLDHVKKLAAGINSSS